MPKLLFMEWLGMSEIEVYTPEVNQPGENKPEPERILKEHIEEDDFELYVDGYLVCKKVDGKLVLR